MAKYRILFALAALLAVGCQPDTLVVAHLPPPSFTGPTIVERPAPPRVLPAPLPPGKVTPVPHERPGGPYPSAWYPQVSPRAWRFIVIHHSASPAGSMAVFDREHRAKGWDEVGYDFVIGNGTDTGDGQVQVTPRWTTQKQGAHCYTPDELFNKRGVGICLVGNFDRTRPTRAQMQSLVKLVAFLMQRYDIPLEHVLGHRDCKPTDCPGRNFRVGEVRRLANERLRAEGVAVQHDRSYVPPMGWHP